MKAVLFATIACMTLAGPAFAQREAACGGTASPVKMGRNGHAAFDIRAGEACLWTSTIDGAVSSSRIVRRPAKGRLTEIDAQSFRYEARRGFRGTDRFLIEATGQPERGRRPVSRISVRVNVIR